jgi:peptide deformylase
LIANMFETMYNANGVGLAAPQIGLSLRLFVMDSTQIKDDLKKGEEGIKKVFINAKILEEKGQSWAYEEGCLSIPHIRGEVMRPETVTLRYFDEKFVEYTETYSGINARVIQHEYDHIEGKIFTDRLKPLKKSMIQNKLKKMSEGQVSADYKIKVARN